MFSEAFSLELTKIVIPAYKFHHEAALLECQYELRNNNRNYHNRFNNNKDYGHRSMHTLITDDNNGIDHIENDGSNNNGASSDGKETLYAVKWYKDNEEFYRYVPKADPPQQSYRVDGVQVDVSISKSSQKTFKKRIDGDTNFKCCTVPLY